MSSILTVATRGGRLAVAQTNSVAAALKQKLPDLQIKIEKVATLGDRDRQTALWSLKDTGFFTSEVENALLEGRADIAVHSFKDLPTRRREGLTVSAVCGRQFVEDCLLARTPLDSIDSVPVGARIGTSSLRRAAQLKHLRPDLDIVGIRGNVPTRIALLETDTVDAVILARAGIERLGLRQEISLVFDPAEFLPAPAQGALAVQARADDSQTLSLLAAIDDKTARLLTSAERQVLTTMKCGCHAPVGAFARAVDAGIAVTAFVCNPDGTNFIRRSVTGPVEDAVALARKLAGLLLDAGGAEILENLSRHSD